MIKKRNMKSKNRDQDRWHSHLHALYGRAFSQRYRELAQVQSIKQDEFEYLKLSRTLSYYRGF